MKQEELFELIYQFKMNQRQHRGVQCQLLTSKINELQGFIGK